MRPISFNKFSSQRLGKHQQGCRTRTDISIGYHSGRKTTYNFSKFLYRDTFWHRKRYHINFTIRIGHEIPTLNRFEGSFPRHNRIPHNYLFFSYSFYLSIRIYHFSIIYPSSIYIKMSFTNYSIWCTSLSFHKNFSLAKFSLFY